MEKIKYVHSFSNARIELESCRIELESNRIAIVTGFSNRIEHESNRIAIVTGFSNRIEHESSSNRNCDRRFTHHLYGGDSPRLLIATVSKLYFGRRQLSVSVLPQIHRWTTNCSWQSHSTRVNFFIISCHSGATRTTF